MKINKVVRFTENTGAAMIETEMSVLDYVTAKNYSSANIHYVLTGPFVIEGETKIKIYEINKATKTAVHVETCSLGYYRTYYGSNPNKNIVTEEFDDDMSFELVEKEIVYCYCYDKQNLTLHRMLMIAVETASGAVTFNPYYSESSVQFWTVKGEEEALALIKQDSMNNDRNSYLVEIEYTGELNCRTQIYRYSKLPVYKKGQEKPKQKIYC